MNIILGEEHAQTLQERYTILSLDTFQVAGHDQPVKSYCVIENVPVQEIPKIDQWRNLHENLIINYGRQNWNFCEQAIEHLQGKWNKELDSFYQDLLDRVESRKPYGVDPAWSPVIER
jgi:hypothetical protein